MVKLSELGEREVVSRISSIVMSDAAIGPGDDAAAIGIDDDYLVASTDLIRRTTHMPHGMTDWQMGWMVAAVNLSDIAAMGARPLGLLLSMLLPGEVDLESVIRMVEGAQDCSRSVGASLIGGDTKEGEEIVLCGTALGRVARERILLRSGASPGDLLAVTGPMGLAAAGYLALQKGLEFEEGVKSLLQPMPRVAKGLSLSACGGVTSCIDISDGLASSVHQLSASSGVFFHVQLDAIPTHLGVKEISMRAGEDLKELLLYFGGDYELLFTLEPESLGRVRRELRDELWIIGEACEGGENLLITDNGVVELENRGYEHFR